MLYAFGSNGSGQLGVGHSDDLPSPGLNKHEGRQGRPLEIRQIAAGGNHTLLLDDNGDVVFCGSDEHRQRDCAPYTRERVEPSDVTFPPRALQVSATWCASIYLCRNGAVATAGQGLNGELGLGEGMTTTSFSLRSIVDFPPPETKVIQIASCMAHTVAVLDNGQVYGWGKSRRGQLGEPAEDVWSPRRIEGIPFHAVKAVCGKDFTCIIGDRKDGMLSVLGVKGKDRFGLLASKPTAVPDWEDIAASWGSVYVLKDDGHLVGFGRDDHGQLPPPDLPPIEAIAAGSEHCLALTKAGKVLAWGWGEHGNCGQPTDANGDVKGRWNEIEVPCPVTAVYAGCATSFVVTADDAEQG